MTELTQYRPGQVETFTGTDPTGGRLVSWAQAASAANALARSLVQTAFVPRVKVGQNMVPLSVGDATAAILMGDELGLSPLAALRSIYVVHGTPALYARTMVALVMSQGHEVWTEVTSDAKVTVCGRRRGSEHVERSEWTIQRATKAKYTSNPKYASNPQEMLYSKAAGEIARKIAPDVLAGVPYSVEDLELETPPTTRTVTRETVEAKAKVSRTKPEPAEPEIPEPEVETAAEPEAAADAEVEPDVPTDDPITSKSSKHLHALVTDLGLTRDQKLAGLSNVTGREIASSKDLTESEAAWAIDSLKARVAARDAEEAGA